MHTQIHAHMRTHAFIQTHTDSACLMTARGALVFIDPPASEGQGLRVICHRAGGDSDTRTLQTELTDHAVARGGRLMRVMRECRLRSGQS